VPSGAATGPLADLDGDGNAETLWLSVPTAQGERRMGVAFSGGGGSDLRVDSASPVGFVAFAEDVDSSPAIQILVSDNRQAQLFTIGDCTLQPVRNQSGDQYSFDLGFGDFGTGVGCLPSGDQRLVGLNVVSDDGTTVNWTRTVVEVNGNQARNGAQTTGTFTRPGDAQGIDSLHTISCGTRTIEHDGVRQPEG
jgi:hypothetical protein